MNPSAPPTPALHPLQKAISGALLHEAESMARRFVALHPDDRVAWRELLSVVNANGRPAEVVRLAKMALQHFPDDAVMRHRLAVALTMTGQSAAAEALLSDTVERERKASPQEALLLAALLLPRQPAKALRLGEAVLRIQPGNLEARQLVRSARSMQLAGPGQKPVFFHEVFDWHGLIQAPVLAACEAQGLPFWASPHAWLAQTTALRAVVVSEINVVLSRELAQMAPGVPLVNTRHGVSVNGKNYGLYAAAAADRVCVSSPWVGSEICRLGLLPDENVWVTGYPQMDPLFQKLAAARGQTAPHQGKRVLVAATFNPQGNAALMLGTDPVRALRGEDTSIHVTLTVHPHTRTVRPDLVASWKSMSAQLPHVRYVDTAQTNALELLADADVLVSDTSSMATMFMALDRPLIRLLSPTGQNGAEAAPDEFEPELAAASTTLRDTRALAQAVAQALRGQEPSSQCAARLALRDKLFGGLTDGCAGQRIAQQLAGLST